MSNQDTRERTAKFWRKRPCSEDAGSMELSSSEENLSTAKVSTAQRGRGRTVAGGASARLPDRDLRGRFLRPATPIPVVRLERMESDVDHPGDLSGDSAASPLLLQSNKAEANAAKRAQRKAVAADEVSEMARLARERRAAQTAAGESPSAVELSRQVLGDVDLVLKVATKSGSLKGTYTRALKEAADGIKEAVGVLLNRTSSEETAKLWEENGRLRSELEDLKRELVAQRAEWQQGRTVPAATGSTPVAAPPPSVPSSSVPRPAADAEIEKIVRICMLQCGGMMNARLQGLESRLLPAETLRPPLAADRRRKEEPAKPGPATATKGVKKPAEGPGKPAEGNCANSTVLVEEAWTTVVKRGRKKKAATLATVPPAPKKKRQRPPKVRAPRSAAVVITLQPGAIERGLSYKAVLTEARAKVAFPDLGTPTGFRMRPAITGARLFEVSGASSGEKADILAAKLREVLNPDDVRVSRPTKTAEIRVDGLDDSTTPAEVVAAVAKSGGCPPEDVRAGDIRADTAGLGTVWVRCPVAAANKVADAGRLLVGWVAARVKLLQPRAMRCYRCLDIGHVRARCTAEIDRSEECYRCGRPGHKAAQCSAMPNCSLCTAAGRPAGHRAGGKACGVPAQKKRRGATKTAGGSLPPPQPGRPSADSRPRNVAEEMDCV